MTKIPFTLEAWLKDKSQKVENKYGKEVHLLEYDLRPAKSFEPMIIGYEERGGENLRYAESDLFIVTPEEEMTEFEMAIHRRLNLMNGENLLATELLEETKVMAAELLELAKKEIGTTFDKAGEYLRGRNEGIAEALKDLPRWEKKTIEKGHGMVDVSSLEKFDYIRINGYLMKIEDLEKLPGFKED